MAGTRHDRKLESGKTTEMVHDDGAKSSSKKRKAEFSEVAESSSKKARNRPASPMVVIRNTSGGTDAEEPTKKRKRQPVQTEAAEDVLPLPTTNSVESSATRDEGIVEEEDVMADAEEEGIFQPRTVPEEQDGSGELKEDVEMATAENAVEDEVLERGANISGEVSHTKEAERAIVLQNGADLSKSGTQQSKPQRRQKRDLELSKLSLGDHEVQRKKSEVDTNKAKHREARIEKGRLVQERAQELAREVKMLKREGLAETAIAGRHTKEVKKQKKQPAWSLSTTVAGRFINHDPIFAKDSVSGDALLITATNREILVLSVEASLAVRTYALRQGISICSFSLDNVDPESLHIVCDNGLSFTWRWSTDGSVPQDLEPRDATAVAGGRADDRAPGLLYLKKTKGNSAIWSSRSLYTASKRLDEIQTVSDGECVIAYGPELLVLGMRKDTGKKSNDYIWVELLMTTAVTCMDARVIESASTSKKDKRPARISLALGKTDGKIHLYDDVTSVFADHRQASLPTPRVLHWHREAVSAVKFSRDGSYLISGGKETVLVLWQLNTGKKQFLPHLTSEIERIVVSPEGDRYAIQMGDNSILVLSTSELKPVANFAGLQLACPVPTSSLTTSEYGHDVQYSKSVAAVLHPRHANQLLLAVPATQPNLSTAAAESRPFLQTFDIRTSRHITRQALTRNNVTDLNLGPERTAVAPPDTTLVSISDDGQWLATVDEWMPPAGDVEFLTTTFEEVVEERRKRREVYLKIWRWDEAQGLWTLSSRVDAPHARAGKQIQGAGIILALVADPVTAGFATMGEDGRVRMWKPKTRVRHGVAMKGEGDVELVEWVCKRSVELPLGAEDGRADSPVDTARDRVLFKACLAYSEDASLLAAALTSAAHTTTLVHLLDTSSGDIKATKSGLAGGEHLDHVGFLDRYFIAVVRDAVHVWDLVTDALQQRMVIPSGATLLAINSADGTFAVAVDSRVNVYKPAETRAVHKDDCHQNIAALLAGKGNKGYTLLFGDATVRTLALTGTPVRRALPDAPAASKEKELTIESAPPQGARLADDAEMPEVLALPAADTKASAAIFDEAEDDRPVVRPEQLASIFDVGQSFAMLPVRDMLEAVVGLYGRRPLVQAAA
ncbi:NET1-associated nuclear protein 1 [Friedmanniomyces endolithicus]|uniref:NET1-associated nuclear protein 1 n=1 Tax=Friedmanniomyces endolithicus TaxID=329885 RepID=A0AAN6K6J8_9PEZI|nr:NET1-associated nuclear protein 1 [Friedmanniomyces endolithicus]KAK0966826.1 NET1-associated nuclear protein 1 [Friedmanniomyces endolithicus]KAK1002453.1 NET1-associated nuclear protein 1 [Friedmanniomyces endolithicus]KAK1049256.1 NET1-associated nuclear protein 1 [Friedmanniomyces endolithicus]